ncbi:MAG: DMT family transporter [Marmoricola sp.]
MNALAICIAAASAVGFALSSSLQHRANERLASTHRGGGHLAALLRRPWWVVGQVLALTSFTLHAVALRIGLIVVVQPVVVSGIVLAVPVRAALERRIPAMREIGMVALTAAGLSLFLVSANPTAHDVSPRTGTAAIATAVGVLATLLVVRLARNRPGLARAHLYGAAAGLLFGLTAGLVKLATTMSSTAHGPAGQLWALLTAWPTWAVVVVGISGVSLNQRAYRCGPLSASIAILNIIDVLVAIGFGIVVFHERPASSVPAVLGQLVGIVVIVVGLRGVARSHALDDGEVEAAPADAARRG